MHTDAVCGQAICGATTCGTWWAEPPIPGLALVAIEPIESGFVVILVPAAQLSLGPVDPALGEMSQTLEAEAAGLSLEATDSVAEIREQRLDVLPAELQLGGLTVIFVGQEFVQPSTCDEIDLVSEDCDVLVLTPAGCEGGS